MSILDRLKDDMIEATKARESERLGVIRFVRSEMKYRAIELGRDLKDEDAIEVLSRVAKRHREAIDQLLAGGKGGDFAAGNVKHHPPRREVRGIVDDQTWRSRAELLE